MAREPGQPAPARLRQPQRLGAGEDKEPHRPARVDFSAGSLLIPGLRSWGHARPDGYGQDHQFKVGVQVRKGGTATLVVPAAFHRVAGLLYAEPARLAETPAEADHAVVFTACADHHTPFIGGFFVLEPRCVPLEIRPAGGGRSARSSRSSPATALTGRRAGAASAWRPPPRSEGGSR
jgi:hypothetical protein